MLVGKIHLPGTCYSFDGTGGGGSFDFQVSYSSGVERNTAAACIKDEVEGVGIFIHRSLYNDNTTGKHFKREPGNQARLGRHKPFLRPGRSTLKGEEDGEPHDGYNMAGVQAHRSVNGYNLRNFGVYTKGTR